MFFSKRKAKLKLELTCNFWANSLAPATDLSVTFISHQIKKKMQEVNSSSPIVAGIIARRLVSQESKDWYYLKPNFDPITTDSHTQQAMCNLDNNFLDILLLLSDEDFDLNHFSQVLGFNFSKNDVVTAKDSLYNIIQFKKELSGSEKYRVIDLFSSSMANEIVIMVDEYVDTQSKILSKKELKGNVFVSILVFATIDIVAILSLLGIINLVDSTDIIYHNYNYDLYGLYLEPTTLPNGYKKIEHSISPLYAETIYKNSSNNKLIFTQQVSEKKITSFNNSLNYTLYELNSTPYAIVNTGDEHSISWYNDYYAYNIKGDITQNELISIVTDIRPKTQELPIYYNTSIAIQMGDIMSNALTNENTKQINSFYQNYLNSVDDSIRIYKTDSTGVTVITLTSRAGQVYIYHDYRYQDNPNNLIEYGYVGDKIEIVSTNDINKHLIIYFNDSNYVLLEFQ